MIDNSLSKRNLFVRIISFSWIRKTVLVEIIAHLFIILFLYTGVAKLMEFDVFQEQLGDSPVLGPVAPIVAWGLPITEFVISLLLFFPRFRLKGLYASFIIMILFTAYVITILSIDKELPCSCGGIIEALSWKGHLIVNSGLVILAFAGIKMQRNLTRQSKMTEDRYIGSHV